MTGLPEVGSTWHDAGGRSLTVTEVRARALDGREVVGLIPGSGVYSSTLATWALIWRDQTPVWKAPHL